LDVDDNCPLIANPNQIDTDEDDIGNFCDDDDDDEDNDEIIDSEDLITGEPVGYDIVQSGNSLTVTSESTDDVVFVANSVSGEAEDLEIISVPGALVVIEGLPDSEKTVFFLVDEKVSEIS